MCLKGFSCACQRGYVCYNVAHMEGVCYVPPKMPPSDIAMYVDSFCPHIYIRVSCVYCDHVCAIVCFGMCVWGHSSCGSSFFTSQLC